MKVQQGPDVIVTVHPMPGPDVELVIEDRENEWHFPLSGRAVAQLIHKLKQASEEHSAPLRI